MKGMLQQTLWSVDGPPGVIDEIVPDIEDWEH